MSTMTHEPNSVIAPQQDTFRAERDALLPRPGYVILPANDDYPHEEYLKIPRLNMRRTLRLSQWLDVVGNRDSVQSALGALSESFGAVDAVVDEEGNPVESATSAVNMVVTINKFIASLTIQEALELFSIVTGQSHEWLDDRWELGWGIEAIKVAFQQQGFADLFKNAGGGTDNQNGGETTAGKAAEVSAPQSISYSPHMGGQTT